MSDQKPNLENIIEHPQMHDIGDVQNAIQHLNQVKKLHKQKIKQIDNSMGRLKDALQSKKQTLQQNQEEERPEPNWKIIKHNKD